MRVSLLFVAACLVACSGPGAGHPVLHAIPPATGLDTSMDAAATPDSTVDGLTDVIPTDTLGPDAAADVALEEARQEAGDASQELSVHDAAKGDTDAGDGECSEACFEQSCGWDPCGNFCGSCPGGLTCLQSQCVCVPSCQTALCGDDGCGGSCGECDDGEECASGECVTIQVDDLPPGTPLSPNLAVPPDDAGEQCSTPGSMFECAGIAVCRPATAEYGICESCDECGNLHAPCVETNDCEILFTCFFGKCTATCNFETPHTCGLPSACTDVGHPTHGVCDPNAGL